MKRVIATALITATCLAAISSSWSQATPTTPAPATSAPAKKAKVAVVKLSETLVERPESFGLSLTSLLSSTTGKSPALSELMTRLNTATADPALKGVLVDLTAFSLSLNQAQEIGGLLTNVRKAGKRVAIYASDFDMSTYVLATYADAIIMPENGNVLIPGAGLQMIFFAGALEKLNMTADFVQVGKFKGAEEPFTRKTASPEYKAQIEKLADGMYGQIVSTIAANRPNLTEEQVKQAIDEGWFTGKRAKAMGLVDQTITRDHVDEWINAQFPAGADLDDSYGQVKKKSLDLSSPLAILSLLGGDTAKPRNTDPAIAVIYATGEITTDTAGSADMTEIVTPAMIRKAVKSALENDGVKAIVLRVDSPGGSASAS